MTETNNEYIYYDEKERRAHLHIMSRFRNERNQLQSRTKQQTVRYVFTSVNLFSLNINFIFNR